MKVIKSNEGYLEFDNGVAINSFHKNSCCEDNYLDFEQFPIGTELPTMSVEELCKNLVLRPDGLILKDSEGVPKWSQARSVQNGYYSDSVGVEVSNRSLGNAYILVSKEELDREPDWPMGFYNSSVDEVIRAFDLIEWEDAYSTDIVWVNTKDRSTIPAKLAERNDKEQE